MYTERFYRDWMGSEQLERFAVRIGESDLLILSERRLEREAAEELGRVRGEIERYIDVRREFAEALAPVAVAAGSPGTVQRMARAARPWAVGPMAAVAGAVAGAVGERLARDAETVIVENGGDVYAKSPVPLRFALYAGEASPFSDKVRFELDASGGVGVCTSSGRVGPSLSFGRADAVVAVHPDAAFADAAATAIANHITGPDDVERVVNEEQERGALAALVACAGDRLGIFGDIELVRA